MKFKNENEGLKKYCQVLRDLWKVGKHWPAIKPNLDSKIQNTIVDINNDLNMNSIAKDIKQKYKWPRWLKSLHSIKSAINNQLNQYWNNV